MEGLPQVGDEATRGETELCRRATWRYATRRCLREFNVGRHRLIETAEAPYSGVYTGFDVSYRAQYDDQYTRYSIDRNADAPAKVVAQSLDGSVYFFGEKTLISSNGGFQDETRWPLTTSIDRFGNRVEYHYKALREPTAAVGQTLEFVLDYIEYGRNDNAGLTNYAMIDLDYRDEARCGDSLVAPGASVNHRWKHLRSRGAHKLATVQTFVRKSPGLP